MSLYDLRSDEEDPSTRAAALLLDAADWTFAPAHREESRLEAQRVLSSMVDAPHMDVVATPPKPGHYCRRFLPDADNVPDDTLACCPRCSRWWVRYVNYDVWAAKTWRPVRWWDRRLRWQVAALRAEAAARVESRFRGEA